MEQLVGIAVFLLAATVSNFLWIPTVHAQTNQPQCRTVTRRTTPAVDDPDIRLTKRGRVDSGEPRSLIDVGGDTDPRAPQLGTLLGGVNTSPNITNVYQVNDYDGASPIVNDHGNNWGVTLMEWGTDPNQTIHAPHTGYKISELYNYTVLYASEHELTLKNTLEDDVVFGYTVHLTDLNVNPVLLEMYNKNEASGRNMLLAIPCGFPVGTALNSAFDAAIRDTGSYMDPRSRKDWWHDPVGASCSGAAPGFVRPLPTQVCKTPGDVVNQPLNVSQVEQLLLNNEGLVQLGQRLGFDFSGNVRPSRNLLDLPELTQYGRWLRAAFPALTPQTIQSQTTNFTNPQYVTGAGRLCVYDPETGELRINEPSNDTYKSVPVPGINLLTQYGTYINTTRGKATRDNQNYQTPTLEMDPALARECETLDSGGPQRLIRVATRGQNSWGGETGTRIPPVIVRITEAFATILNRLTQRDQLTVRAHVLTTQKTPYAETFASNIAGTTTQDLAQASISDGERARLAATGGFAQTFQPASLTYRSQVSGELPNAFDRRISQAGAETIQTRFYLTKVTTDALDFVQCGLLPKTLQPVKCVKDWRVPQYGTLTVPDEVSSFANEHTPPPSPGQGILGMEYLQKYAQDLITRQLSSAERARMMTRIQELIDRYVGTGTWPNSELADPARQRAIQEFAQQNGFNEAFLYALWLEETHAGSVGDYPFGCGGYTDFDDSLNCLVNDPAVQTYIRDPLPEALCTYADGHYPCDFSAHPNFIRNLMSFYDYLTAP